MGVGNEELAVLSCLQCYCLSRLMMCCFPAWTRLSHHCSGLIHMKSKWDAKCEWQFISCYDGAVVGGHFDLCNEGTSVCGPGDWKVGTMGKRVIFCPLGVSIFPKGLDKCPGPVGRFEGIKWHSLRYEFRHCSASVMARMPTQCKWPINWEFFCVG